MRAKVVGTSKRPRLCVFRSSVHIYAQLIDDEKGKTILSSSDLELKKEQTKKKEPKTQDKKKKIKVGGEEKLEKTGKRALAHEVGRLIADKALKRNIRSVVFDRAGYKYHGRVKAVAEGAREGGLKF